MKRVMILLDGIIAKGLLNRLVALDTSHSTYDVVYMNDEILPETKPQNFTFYKFDPTSYSKLKLIMSKVSHNDILVAMSNKDDTLAVIKNIDLINPNIHFNVFNEWGLEFDNENIQDYNAVDVLSNGLIERLPGVPVVAQNVGLKQGEIMEIRIPFGSSYAYRYIGSISQKDWKIFALYRNNMLINVKPTLILKPNDIILIIGKPKVLLQVFTAISKSSGHFPMPFGKNIYVYLDMCSQSEDEVVSAIRKARYLTERMKNTRLIIKITRPTTIELINKIRNHIVDIDDKIIEYDYHNLGVENILGNDIRRFDVGLVVVSNSLLQNMFFANEIIRLNIPIFKVGLERIREAKTVTIVLNDTTHYEQISPVVFDITSQLMFKLQVIDSDPIGDIDRENLIEHLDNLSKIFNQDIKIESSNKNPIKLLEKQKNQLQILPLRDDMFRKRITKFFSTDSDHLSYDLKYVNQIMIPIIEEEKDI
jgi:hypothetical protein